MRRPRGRPPSEPLLRAAWERMQATMQEAQEAREHGRASKSKTNRTMREALDQYALTRALFQDSMDGRDIRASAQLKANLAWAPGP